MWDDFTADNTEIFSIRHRYDGGYAYYYLQSNMELPIFRRKIMPPSSGVSYSSTLFRGKRFFWNDQNSARLHGVTTQKTVI
jgi:hypothetical protein